MKIILIRHGKVCYKWRGLVTSEGFNQACIGYDNGEIKIDEVPQRDLDIDLIYISGLQRTYDTANILFPGRVYVKNDIFNEVPFNSFMDTKIKLPMFVWLVIGRMQWMFNVRRQFETKKETVLRAREAIKVLETQGRDCILVSHGLFMRNLNAELRRQNYVVKGKSKYNNLSRIYFER